jgi:hypothetical protein
MNEPTFWNGEPCTARRVVVRVGHSPRSTWWCAELEGQERAAVEVTYGTSVFLLDDEDGSGWRKVTVGRGSPGWGHSGLPEDSVVLRDAPPPKPLVEVATMCNEHNVKTLERLGIGPDGPWMATLVTMQLLLFRATMADERIHKRTGGDANAISLILAEIGCPACARKADFKRALVVMRKGLTHSAKVARGELYDADFGIPANAPEAPGEGVPSA